MKQTMLGFILAIILLISCSKSNNSPISTANQSIAGQWKLDSVTLSFYNAAGQFDSSEIGYPLVGTNDSLYFQFNEDSNWFESLVAGVDTIIVTEGTYSFKSGNSFTLSYPNASPTRQNEPCNIISLTNTSFVFSKQRQAVFNGTNPGTITYVFKLRK